jgi:hypothetical protein
LNAVHFGCAEKTNCTSDELAFKQWGSYSITNNPRIYITTTNYMPQTRTLYGWSTNSSWPIEGVEEPMEYAYYTSTGYWTEDD